MLLNNVGMWGHEHLLVPSSIKEQRSILGLFFSCPEHGTGVPDVSVIILSTYIINILSFYLSVETFSVELKWFYFNDWRNILHSPLASVKCYPMHYAKRYSIIGCNFSNNVSSVNRGSLVCKALWEVLWCKHLPLSERENTLASYKMLVV